MPEVTNFNFRSRCMESCCQKPIRFFIKFRLFGMDLHLIFCEKHYLKFFNANIDYKKLWEAKVIPED